jgi:hypothetical protein
MKPVVPLALLWVLSAGGLSLTAQTPNSTADIEQLRSIVGEQQRTLEQQQKGLEQQQAQILALQSALAEQKKMLLKAVQVETNGATLVPAADRNAGNDLQSQSEPTSLSSDQPPLLTPQQEQVQEELQRGPEIADVTPTTPALQLGPAKVSHCEQSACLHLKVVSNLHLGSGQRYYDHKEQPHNARG